jgi:hypothetical protein
MSLEPLHFLVETDSSQNVQRLESGCFFSERLVTCERFGFIQESIRQIDDTLDAIAIGPLGKFQTHSPLRRYACMSQVVRFHQSCLIDVH